MHESSNMKGKAHISCIKYQNLNNISHYHSDHELVYVNEGKATVTVNETVFNLARGECVFIHSNDIHYIQSDEATVVSVLKAGYKYFEKIFVSKGICSQIINNSFDIENVLNDIRREFKSSADNSDIMADCIATQLFITIIRDKQIMCCEKREHTKKSATELYNEICKKISCEYRTVTFEEAAKHMHFSGPYFSKVFHNVFGMTFTQYLNAVRIAAAIEKLKLGDMSVTEISVSCGFNTIRNFNRVFKSLTGYTPNSLPSDYVFLYSLQDGYGLDPTLNCTRILE